MAGVALTPSAVTTAKVDVVSVRLLQATVPVWLLHLESIVVPVLVERHLFGNLHDIDKMSLSSLLLAAGADDPITCVGTSTDLRLAGC